MKYEGPRISFVDVSGTAPNSSLVLGEPGIVPRFVSSEIDGDYNLIVARSDGAREIIPLSSAFEHYYWSADRCRLGEQCSPLGIARRAQLSLRTLTL